MLHFSEEEFARRRTELIARMAERKLDAMLLFSQESMYWLSGYDTFGFCFFQCLVFRRDGEMRLLTRSADLRQAKQTSNIETIAIWTDGANANPAAELRDLLSNMDLLGTNLGVEYDSHGLTARSGKMLDDTLKSFATLSDASDIVVGLRTIKSEEEIEKVRLAAKASDLALDAAVKVTKAGADEGKILAEMQGAIFEFGGDYAGNEFIIGSGADALLCRYKSGRRTLSENDQLTLEWSGAYSHYHAPMMRTIVIGKPRREHLDMFDAAQNALMAVESAMISGNSFGDVFEAHAKSMDAAGLAKHRLNACGYSVGAVFTPCWMDPPMFYSRNPYIIEPNMTLFAHMILMDSESETAMCLGRTYLTKDDKPEALSAHPLDMIIL